MLRWVVLWAMSACGFPVLPRLTTGDAAADDATGDAPTDAKTGVDLMSDEGGEVRFEMLRLVNGMERARVVAFFASDDDDDYHELPTNPGCTELVNDDRWPTNQPSNRTYVDVGDLSLTNGIQTLAVPRSTHTVDPLGRMLEPTQWYYHSFAGNTPGSVDNDASMYVTPETLYDVTFTGSASWPGQIHEDAIYMPADFSLTTPAFTDTVTLEAGTALTVGWSVTSSGQPTGVSPARVLVGFVSAGTNGPALWCLEQSSAGTLTVSGPDIDFVRSVAPNGGILLRQVHHHQVRELTNGASVANRRIDMIGAITYVSQFMVAL